MSRNGEQLFVLIKIQEAGLWLILEKIKSNELKQY